MYESLSAIDPVLATASNGFQHVLETEDELAGLEGIDTEVRDAETELAQMEARLLQLQNRVSTQHSMTSVERH